MRSNFKQHRSYRLDNHNPQGFPITIRNYLYLKIFQKTNLLLYSLGQAKLFNNPKLLMLFLKTQKMGRNNL